MRVLEYIKKSTKRIAENIHENVGENLLTLSTLAVCAILIFPTPISPAAENLTPS